MLRGYLGSLEVRGVFASFLWVQKLLLMVSTMSTTCRFSIVGKVSLLLSFSSTAVTNTMAEHNLRERRLYFSLYLFPSLGEIKAGIQVRT